MPSIRSHMIKVAVTAAALVTIFIVLSWQSLSEQESQLVTHTNTTRPSPRVLHYNRHLGAQAEMRHVASRLGISVSSMDPASVSDYGIDAAASDSLVENGFVAELCARTDAVVVSDTVPDARPFLHSLLHSNASLRCSAALIIHATNRFDYMREDEDFHRLIWTVTNHPTASKHVFWVANNPLEPMDMARTSLALPKWRLLRSTGFSDLEAKPVAKKDAALALYKPHETGMDALAAIQKLEIPFKRVEHDYGGPKTAALHAAFIEIPYQVSVMKLYENLANGVVMLVPSKAFFKELVDKKTINFLYWRKLVLGGDDWWKYMDYYSDDIAPYLYYFDSWDHLKKILTSSEIDTKNVRARAPKAYAALVKESLNGWADIFSEIGFSLLVDGEEPGKGVPVFKSTLPSGIHAVSSDNVDDWRRVYYGALLDFKKKWRGF
ncbi:hypothetical protein HDU80_006130 [Chytriomyces hyalinus]|nr:hypothetical protein HDU80_006130 [Chytriomyces hyalinus]